MGIRRRSIINQQANPIVITHEANPSGEHRSMGHACTRYMIKGSGNVGIHGRDIRFKVIVSGGEVTIAIREA
jgi:hypothetical protein